MNTNWQDISISITGSRERLSDFVMIAYSIFIREISAISLLFIHILNAV